MRVTESAGCTTFLCAGAQHVNNLIPHPEVTPRRVSTLLISESAPADPIGHYDQSNPKSPPGGVRCDDD
jgi:hypothetical protein